MSLTYASTPSMADLAESVSCLFICTLSVHNHTVTVLVSEAQPAHHERAERHQPRGVYKPSGLGLQ